MAGKVNIGLEVEKEFDGMRYKGWVIPPSSIAYCPLCMFVPPRIGPCFTRVVWASCCCRGSLHPV